MKKSVLSVVITTVVLSMNIAARDRAIERRLKAAIEELNIKDVTYIIKKSRALMKERRKDFLEISEEVRDYYEGSPSLWSAKKDLFSSFIGFVLTAVGFGSALFYRDSNRKKGIPITGKSSSGMAYIIANYI